jgi:hypothetical protein
VRKYEGSVKFAAGEVISLQCFEGRCGECPDYHDSESADRPPTLEGYYCEHGCRGVTETNPNREGEAKKARDAVDTLSWATGLPEHKEQVSETEITEACAALYGFIKTSGGT